jgi:ABC-type glycerol-3-phosphate transport system permease component
MVSVAGVIGLLVIVLVNSAVTALMTRFFRVRLHTRWGSLVYSLLLCPVVMVVILLVLSGVFRLGGNLGSQTAVILVTVIIPLAVGITFDYFWMPAPDEVELPASMD